MYTIEILTAYRGKIYANLVKPDGHRMVTGDTLDFVLYLASKYKFEVQVQEKNKLTKIPLIK